MKVSLPPPPEKPYLWPLLSLAAATPSSESESFPPFAALRPRLRFRDLARPRDAAVAAADVEEEGSAAATQQSIQLRLVDMAELGK